VLEKVEDSERVFVELGFSEQEFKIYLFLLKKGANKAKYIGTSLSMTKGAVYRSLKALLDKGFITSTIEMPSYYVPVPVQTVFQNVLNKKEREIQKIINNKKVFIDNLRSLQINYSSECGKFTVLGHTSSAYAKAIEMAKNTTSDLLIMQDYPRSQWADTSNKNGELYTTTNMAIDLFSIYKNLKSKVRLKFISNLNHKQLRMTIKNPKKNCEWRYLDLHFEMFPRFIISDENQMLLSISQKVDLSLKMRDNYFWTDDKTIVRLMRMLFEGQWNKSIDITNE
jgi:sugar-specific transcriptional regulator TrmB